MSGIRVWNEYGTPQITNGSAFPFGYVTTGILELRDDGAAHPQPIVTGSVVVTNGTNPIVAFAPVAGVSINEVYMTSSGSTFTFHYRAKSSSPINTRYWVFDVPAKASKDPTLSSAGLRSYDATGVLTYDAATDNFKVVGYLAPTMPNPTSPGQGALYETEQSIAIPSGKTYAVAQALNGYAATMWYTGQHAAEPGGALEVDPGTGGLPPQNGWWSVMELEAYYTGATRVGNTIWAGMHQFEYWKDWYPYSSTGDHVDVYGSASHVVIDVSNLPGGSTGAPTSVNVSQNATSRTASSAPGVTSISNAVTITSTGGTSPYTVLWERVAGSSLVTNQDPLNATSFRTKVTDQAGGTTYQAVWRAKVTDANNIVGYSQDITFTHTSEAVDVTPVSVDWPNLTSTITEASGFQATETRTITGINQPITIRATISNLTKSSNVGTSSRLDIQRNNAYVHDTSGLGNGYWTQAVVNNGQTVRFIAHASVSSGIGTLSYTVTVTNVTTGATLDTFTVSQTVGSDDITPDAISLGGISASTPNNVLGDTFSNAVQITGISVPITLRIERYNNVGVLDGGLFWVQKASSSSGPWTDMASFNPFLSGFRYGDVVVNNGEWIRYGVKGMQTTAGRKEFTCTITLRNQTAGGTTIGASRNVSIIVDADDNYPPDPVPNAVNWTNIIGSNTVMSLTSETNSVTIGGINQTITLRGYISGLSETGAPRGGATNLQIWVNGSLRGGASGVGNGYWCATTVNSGDVVKFVAIVESTVWNQRTQLDYTVTVRNMTDTSTDPSGVVLDTFTVSHSTNEPDRIPDPISFPNQTWSTNNNITYGAFQTVGPTATGTNRPLALRFQITSLTSTSDYRLFTVTDASNNSYNGSIEGFGLNSYLDVDIPLGGRIQPKFSIGTNRRKQTCSGTITVRNRADNNAVVGTFNFSITVDADDNYNLIVTPNALNWTDVSSTTNGQTGTSNSNTQTIAGLEQAIQIRFDPTVSINTVRATSSWGVFVNGTRINSTTTNSSAGVMVTVNNGDQIYYRYDLGTDFQKAEYKALITVTNVTAGNTVIDTFNVHGTVDADNNYGNTPTAVDWPNHSATVNEDTVTTASQFRQITGINGPITIQVETSGYSGDLSTAYTICHHNTPGNASSNGPWSNALNVNAPGATRTFTIENNQWIYFRAYGATTSGKKSGSWTTTIRNMNTGAVIDTFTSTLTVDNDGNFNIPDYIPNTITWANHNINTPSNVGESKQPVTTIAGVNRTTTLRWTISGHTTGGSAGGTLTSVLDVYKNYQYQYRTPTGNSNWARASYVVGDTLEVVHNVSTSSGRKTVNYTVNVTVQETGTNIGSYTVAAVVDSDDNYNKPLAPVVNQTWMSNWEFAMPGTFYQSSVYYGTILTITGGSGSYTSIVWEKRTSNANWTVSGTTNPSFYFNGVVPYNMSMDWRAKVTDSLGAIAYSDWVTVELSASNELS